MLISVTSVSTDSVFPLDIPGDLEIENLKAFCEAESGIPAAEILLLFEGKPLRDDKKTVQECGIKEGDMIALQKNVVNQRRPMTGGSAASPAAGGLQLPDFSQIVVPGASASAAPAPSTSRQQDDPQYIMDMLKANPENLAMLKQNNPRLAEAFESGKMDEFAKVLAEQQEARAERDRQRMRLLTADPFDMEAQRLIAQEIENKNVEANMELAMEYNPESFGTVIMLYINCKVNGHEIKAFVDSGAQATIMSQSAAERCGISRLIDVRWAGIAKGVGTQKILGRVHMAQLQIENDFLSSSFSILAEQPMDMLLGLDMLKRHQCQIDLKRNVLLFGSTGTETKFLTESELPECAKLSSKAVSLEDAMAESAKEAEKSDLERAMAESKRHKGEDTSGQPTAASSAGAATVTSTTVGPSDKFTENDVKKLVEYGFSRERVFEELRASNGDVTTATAALFAKSLTM